MDVVLASDIGGTNNRTIMCDLNGRELGRTIVPTIGDDYAASLEAMRHAVHQLVGSSHPIATVGVAVAGCLKDGIMTGSGNLPDWVGHNLATDFATMCETTKVVVLNDCEAAALGEHSVLGQDLVYVIWGTGVGAAVARKGEVKPTELGHIILDVHSKTLCGCGGFGHLEALVSGVNVPKRFDCKIEDVTDAQWSEVLADLAAGLRSMSCGDLNLPIVLGGGVSAKQLSSTGKNRLAELQGHVNQLPAPAAVPTLHLAMLGEDSGLVGASVAALQLLTV